MAYIGIFPYIFIDKPVKIGDIEFVPVTANEENTRRSADDNRHLQTLISYFKDWLGKPLVNATYFIADTPNKSIIDSVINEIQNCVHLFRFLLLSTERYSFEQTLLFFCETPPLYEKLAGDKSIYACYRCFINFQNYYYARTNIPMYPPLPNYRTASISTGDFRNLEEIRDRFYKQHSGLAGPERERIIRAVDLFNQTFQRNPIIDEREKIYNMSVAFEVLLDLPADNTVGALSSRLQALLGNSAGLSSWCRDFYDAGLKILRSSKSGTLQYKHPHSGTELTHFLNVARKIFIYCVRALMTDTHGGYEDKITRLFTSNEVYLENIKKAETYDELKSGNLIREVSLLHPSHPVGDKDDIIKLGRLILQSYKDLYLAEENKGYLPTIDTILNFEEPDIDKLGKLYFKAYEEFEYVYSRNFAVSEGVSSGLLPNAVKSGPDIDRIRLEQAILSFTQFASFALTQPGHE